MTLHALIDDGSFAVRPTVGNSQIAAKIEALLVEAAAAHDYAQVALCQAALAGSVAAEQECMRVIRRWVQER
jgi:hypothetical protein